MRLVMNRFEQIRQAYEAWVAANPETVCDLEMTSKWVSYFVVGRVSDSTAMSELVYSLSNLLVLYHDRIIEHSRKPVQKSNETKLSAGSLQRIKLLLTVLDHFEVFLEISAQRVWGQRGKWALVSVLQLCKSAGRYYLLRHSSEQIISTPAIPFLNRHALAQQKFEPVSHPKLDGDSFKFQLKRSGRLVRKVEGAPPLQYRDFKFFETSMGEHLPTGARQLFLAECIYIAKPLLHLASMRLAGGTSRWSPYMLALALDLASIRIGYQQRQHLNKEQRLEMSRRCIKLLLYLVRSPFYERHTQARLQRLFGIMGALPIVKLFVGALQNYVPHWQHTYFHLWST